MTEKNKEIVVIDETTIKSKIYYIRNQKIMLDFELAEIYGYETKTFNQQVKNNIEKFDEDLFDKDFLKNLENNLKKDSVWYKENILPNICKVYNELSNKSEKDIKKYLNILKQSLMVVLSRMIS